MADELDCFPPLREVIAKYRLSARKALGQNYILDLNLTRRIARQAGNLEAFDVLEIGAGPGGLTRALLAEGARNVLAVEIDKRFAPALDDLAAHADNRLKIVVGDGLHVRPTDHLEGPIKIISNLPYNVATKFLGRWLEDEPWPPFWHAMVIMLQREVAGRITASPGSKSYGRLSLLCQYRSKAEVAFRVPPQAFVPAPEVESALVRILPRPSPLTSAGTEALREISRAAFGQRRKMLRRSLRPLCHNIEGVLAASGLSPTARAEELSVENYIRMAALLVDQRLSNPDG